MKDLSKRKKGLIAYSIILTIFIVCIGSLYVIDKNYNKLYSNDIVCTDGVIDLAGCDGKSEQAIRMLAGYEFYFNQWLISDNIQEREPDGHLKPTEKWTSLKVDGKALPKEGFASYRLIMKNNPFDTSYFMVGSFSSDLSWRFYVNGHLMTEYGVHTKEIVSDSGTKKHTMHHNYQASKGEDLEIVIEVSGTNTGGVGVPNQILENLDKHTASQTKFWEQIRVMSNISMGLMIACLIFLSVFMITSRSFKYSLSFIGALICIILCLFFSVDYQFTLADIYPSFNLHHLHYFEYGVFIRTLITICWHLCATKLAEFKKTELGIFAGINLGFIIATCLSFAYEINYYIILMHLMSYLYLVYKIFSSDYKFLPEKIAYSTMLLFLMFEFVCMAIDTLLKFPFGGAMIYSIGFIIIVVIMVSLYFFNVNRNQKQVLKAERAIRDNEVLKAQTLKSQIKPHFIFNTLTMIMDEYKKDDRSGEDMINTMAQYMRFITDTESKTLVSFDEELRAVDMYFSLCNKRKEKSINFIHDIEEYDFKLPLLSLQPIIENSIKYSQVEEKSDGFIMIKCFRSNDVITIEVSDNGIGYDTTQIKENSVGLKNMRDRLKLLLDAKVEIASTIGVGTSTTITFKAPKSTETDADLEV